MSLTDLSLTGIIVIMAATFTGCVAFVASYRPLDPRAHGPAGRHLLSMSWALGALHGVSIVVALVPLPTWLMVAAYYVILGAICVVVWQRVMLLRHVRRMDQPDPITAELTERGDEP